MSSLYIMLLWCAKFMFFLFARVARSAAEMRAQTISKFSIAPGAKSKLFFFTNLKGINVIPK